MSQIESESVDRDLFMDVLNDNLDPDEATETIEMAVDHAGLDIRDSYSRDEAIDIANALTELDDVKLFVNISGNTIKARIESGNF